MEGAQRAAYHARTSTSAWKKAVGVFVRRAAQTDRVKERLFESAIQEQQKTLPLDRVVKNECRGGSWPVAWREGGANMPKSAHDEPPPRPESDRRWRGGDKEGGKQVGRGKNQMRSASGKVEPFITAPGKGRGHIMNKVTTKAFGGTGNDTGYLPSVSPQPEAWPSPTQPQGEVDTAAV